MVYKVLGLIPIVILLNHPILFSLKHPELDQQHYGATLDLVNRSVHRRTALRLCYRRAATGLGDWRENYEQLPRTRCNRAVVGQDSECIFKTSQ